MDLLRIFLSLLVAFSSNSFKIRRVADGLRTRAICDSSPRKISDVMNPQHMIVIKTIVPMLLFTSSRSCRADDDISGSNLIVDVNEAAKFVEALQDFRALNSDEFEISFASENLNIRLTETGYKGFPVTTVTGIMSTDLVINHPELQIGAIITKVGEQSCDGIPLSSIAERVASAQRPVTIRFRDPSRFFELLDSSQEGPIAQKVTSSYLPANTRDIGLPEQIIIVERQVLPPPDQRPRGSALLDVMEIQYVATLPNGTIFDSSSKRCPPGSSSRSIYYVLGQRNGPPVGKGDVPFPPGWDLTLRGMVVGEQRKITLPTTLAFYTKPVPGVPRYMPVIYTVKLLSLT